MKFVRTHFQGVPAAFMGLVTMVFLPNRPEMTKFLNEDERRIAAVRRTRGISGDNGFTINKSEFEVRMQ